MVNHADRQETLAACRLRGVAGSGEPVPVLPSAFARSRSYVYVACLSIMVSQPENTAVVVHGGGLQVNKK